MRRAGLLLFAAVPVVATAAVYFLAPSDPADSPARPPASAAQSARQEAKDRAERERAADDAVIAGLPPGLAAPEKKELAQQIVASAENSTLDWRSAYGYIEDIGDGQGYTAGIIGFCTGTHDLLTLVERYTEAHPGNGLARYLPALRKVDGTDSHEGLDPGFTAAWKAEAEVPAFREAQDAERDRVYFDPAVRLAKLDGLGTLGQFVYYDAMVFHGPGTKADGFYGLRDRAMREANTPAEGGSEKAYLDIFLDIRRKAMRSGRADIDTTRIDTAQRRFLYDGNLKLRTPLVWAVYGDTYRVS
ncbi:chitosanase [Streptomyces sp. S.PNR 29]|uniref:chitosanase n=1 Tax=Streptomyces sp. S.PNR 29 TaxID=2973805 RepID=UPI0025B1C5A2|nr:chitosanase [Streptomyces sp. S.PNR 29]MDN0194836.1 chitosanase [Streptomyces sp. S.PNR 29]